MYFSPKNCYRDLELWSGMFFPVLGSGFFPSRIKKHRIPDPDPHSNTVFRLLTFSRWTLVFSAVQLKSCISSHILEHIFATCHFSISFMPPFIFIGSSSLRGHILGPGRQRSEGDKRRGDVRRQESAAARRQDAVAQKRRRRHWHFLPHPHKHWRPREQVWAAGDGRGDVRAAADVGDGGANTGSAATTAAAAHAAGEQHPAARHHLCAAAGSDGRLQLQPHSAAAAARQQTKGGSWTGLRIRIHFIRIRIQHFRLNTDPDTDLDPDPIRIQGFNDQRLIKKYSWKKN